MLEVKEAHFAGGGKIRGFINRVKVSEGFLEMKKEKEI